MTSPIGQSRHGGAGVMVDWMILEVFSNLTDSIIPWFHHPLQPLPAQPPRAAAGCPSSLVRGHLS